MVEPVTRPVRAEPAVIVVTDFRLDLRVHRLDRGAQHQKWEEQEDPESENPQDGLPDCRIGYSIHTGALPFVVDDLVDPEGLQRAVEVRPIP